MGTTSANRPASDATETYGFFALACFTTWMFAWPAALAWMQHRAPGPAAVALAGLSAFGPLIAVLAVAGPRKQLRQVFGRWRTNPVWIAVALATPIVVHLVATALFVAIGGRPDRWFHPPNTPEAVAALVVFPLGEEFGWRGFAHPRLVARFGFVRGCLLLGAIWGLWHLVYSVTPTAAGFDLFGFAMTMIELPLYALLIGWVFERADRSMAVAIAFHAGAHLDHIERAPRTDVRLHLIHMIVLALFATAAGILAAGRRPGPWSSAPATRSAAL